LRRVFLIGPAGVGKSTCGALLAPKLGFGFVDLDSEFNTRVGHIAEFIAREGYLAYCGRNVDLFEALLEEEESDAVYALSSGFLLYEDLDPSYSRLAGDLRRLGVSILLLPAASVEEAAEILGVSRGTAFNMAREYLATGRGLPVLRCGRRLVVLVPRLLQLLGLPDQSEDPAAGGDAA